MANTYTHRIVSLKKSNGIYLNIINSIVVEVTVSDGTNSVSQNYTMNLQDPVDSGADNTFIEYPNITEDQLISWFTNELIIYESAKKDIDKKLKENLQDDVESNFPWS